MVGQDVDEMHLRAHTYTAATHLRGVQSLIISAS
jgi:hypothetical protein